ncbi:MAG: homoserine O-acetyltransferase [Bacteroidota bacterium]
MNQDTKHTSFETPFILESGDSLPAIEIAWKSWGVLNDRKDNVILVCHALTGHAAANEWFSGFFEKDGIIDLDRDYVLCINALGSCYGSTGPSTTNPATGAFWQGGFPEITIRDMVRFQQVLIDHLGITGIQLVIGGSMGGMVALEFALMDHRIQSVACIAMGAKHSPWAVGISHAQRMAIRADKTWNNGFYDPDRQPKEGIAAARAMAMITYRTPENYYQKFGRRLQSGKDVFEVESYLEYQGEKLGTRFDANTYITLSKAMDTHDVYRGREERVLHDLDIPVLVIGINSDLLYPIAEQSELSKELSNSTFVKIKSPYGHDAFLIEFEQINKALTRFYADSLNN